MVVLGLARRLLVSVCFMLAAEVVGAVQQDLD